MHENKRINKIFRGVWYVDEKNVCWECLGDFYENVYKLWLKYVRFLGGISSRAEDNNRIEFDDLAPE